MPGAGAGRVAEEAEEALRLWLRRSGGREAARGRPRDWFGCACAWRRVVEAIVGV